MSLQVLGTNKELRIGEVGYCLRGNPGKIADYHKLESFSFLYFVKIRWHLGYKVYQVVSKMKEGR